MNASQAFGAMSAWVCKSTALAAAPSQWIGSWLGGRLGAAPRGQRSAFQETAIDALGYVNPNGTIPAFVAKTMACATAPVYAVAVWANRSRTNLAPGQLHWLFESGLRSMMGLDADTMCDVLGELRRLYIEEAMSIDIGIGVPGFLSRGSDSSRRLIEELGLVNRQYAGRTTNGTGKESVWCASTCWTTKHETKASACTTACFGHCTRCFKSRWMFLSVWCCCRRTCPVSFWATGRLSIVER